MYKPYPYQTECLEAIQSHRITDHSRALIVMASGLGKTVTMALDAKKFLEWHGKGRCLFLCHNNDILYQAKTTFEAVNGEDHSYGYLTGGKKHLHRIDFLFASFQTMKQHLDLFDPAEFAYIVIDESHHSQANTYQSTIRYFRPVFLLGATATPNRMDMLDIRKIFGQEVFSLPLEDAMVKGLVTPIDYRLMTDEIVIQETLKTDDGKRVSLMELNRKIFIPKRDEEIAKIIARHVAELADPRVMIFCTSIKHCEHLARFIPNSFAIHSNIPEKERAIKFEMFRQGIIGTVLTVNAFNEGIDVPQANVVVFLRSTSSQTVFLQQLGRGLRKSEGKDKVIALDFVANCERIKMVCAMWQSLERDPRRPDTGSSTRPRISPIMLNVDTIEFRETIVPLLKLMDRINPTRISEIEKLNKEYSPKNPIPAEQATAMSNLKYWWTCSICGHEWQATGSNRVSQGRGCPGCSGRAATSRNNMAMTHPKLAQEYLPPPRNPLPANQVIAGSEKKFWWRCRTCSYEWQARGSDRSRQHTGCPNCLGRVVNQNNNLVATFPQLAQEYLPPPRNVLSVENISSGSHWKVWWRCSQCQHEWQAQPANRTKKNHGCPACSGRVASPQNNLIVTHPKLAREYSTRNLLPADQVIAGTQKKLWWICQDCGHEWQATGGYRVVSGTGCSQCRKRSRQ